MVLVSLKHWLSFWTFPGLNNLTNNLVYFLLKFLGRTMFCYNLLLSWFFSSVLSSGSPSSRPSLHCFIMELKTSYLLKPVTGEEVHTIHETLTSLVLFCSFPSPAPSPEFSSSSLKCLLLCLSYISSTLSSHMIAYRPSFLGHRSSLGRRSLAFWLYPQSGLRYRCLISQLWQPMATEQQPEKSELILAPHSSVMISCSPKRHL